MMDFRMNFWERISIIPRITTRMEKDWEARFRFSESKPGSWDRIDWLLEFLDPLDPDVFVILLLIFFAAKWIDSRRTIG